MKKFDHNLLDKYKEAMELLGSCDMCFNEGDIQIGETKEEFFYFIKFNDCTEENLKMIKCKDSYDWEDFKKQVAQYFLNK